MTVSSGGVILVGAKVGKVQCMHNSLIICGPVVGTGCALGWPWWVELWGTCSIAGAPT